MNRNFKIIDTLTSGNFSSIYLINYNNKECILKKEDKTKKTLNNEINIYLKLLNIKHIANIIDYFSDSVNDYLIIEYYNNTLPSFKEKAYMSDYYNKKITNIIIILIKLLEKIHSIGILHRDIKPNNICLNSHFEPVLIDFGLSKFYIENKKHIENKKINNIIGNYNFISKHILQLNQPSMRDDVISCFYVYIYLLVNKDIERNFIGSKIDNNYIKKNIKKSKTLNIDIIDINDAKVNDAKINDEIMNNYQLNCENLIKVHNIIYNLSYFQKPNYNEIINLLK